MRPIIQHDKLPGFSVLLLFNEQNVTKLSLKVELIIAKGSFPLQNETTSD